MIKKTETNLSNWYNNILVKAELVDYGPTRGCIVMRPYGFSIWQQIIASLDKKLQRTGHQQAYFPLLLPENFIEDEKKYVENLDPRVFTVTKGGGEDLSEPLVIRPTSETIISYMFAKWINSYRELPLKLYQWANIVRFEPRTRPFIKEIEILWIEGHTAHASHGDANCEVKLIYDIFEELLKNNLAIPVIMGKEPESRKFAGSLDTYTAEAMMPNGQALQLAAVYDLGQKFAHAFDIKFRNSDNDLSFCWTTNWGLGFRLLGALILVHGDERGLRLPPSVAPIQAIVIPFAKNAHKIEKIRKYCEKICKELCESGVRIKIGDSDRNFSQTLSYWEMRGVPLIIVVGDKEVESESVTIIRRDLPLSKNKSTVSNNRVKENICRILDEIQTTLFQQANEFMVENTATAINLSQFKAKINEGWVVAKWCESAECESKIIEQFGKIIKCAYTEPIKFEAHDFCFFCNAPTKRTTLFSKTY